jgi:hypothetical protein
MDKGTSIMDLVEWSKGLARQMLIRLNPPLFEQYLYYLISKPKIKKRRKDVPFLKELVRMYDRSFNKRVYPETKEQREGRA